MPKTKEQLGIPDYYSAKEINAALMDVMEDVIEKLEDIQKDGGRHFSKQHYESIIMGLTYFHQKLGLPMLPKKFIQRSLNAQKNLY